MQIQQRKTLTTSRITSYYERIAFIVRQNGTGRFNESRLKGSLSLNLIRYSTFINNLL